MQKKRLLHMNHIRPANSLFYLRPFPFGKMVPKRRQHRLNNRKIKLFHLVVRFLSIWVFQVSARQYSYLLARLAQRLNLGRKEAKDLIDGYFATFPAIKSFIADSIDFANKIFIPLVIKKIAQLFDFGCKGSTNK